MTRRERSARTREEILDISRQLILEQGFDRVSWRTIAKAADFSPAGLYEYFDSKQTLLSTLAGRASARLHAALASVEENAHPHDHLVAIGVAYITFALNNREDFLLMFSLVQSSRRSQAAPLPAESPFSIVHRAAVRAYGLDRAGGTAYALWGTAHGLAMLRLTHLAGFEADLDAGDRIALRALVVGLQ